VKRALADDWLVRDAILDTDAEACLDIYAPFIRDTIVSFEEIVPTVEEFRDRMRAAIAMHPWLVWWSMARSWVTHTDRNTGRGPRIAGRRT